MWVTQADTHLPPDHGPALQSCLFMGIPRDPQTMRLPSYLLRSVLRAVQAVECPGSLVLLSRSPRQGCAITIHSSMSSWAFGLSLVSGYCQQQSCGRSGAGHWVDVNLA